MPVPLRVTGAGLAMPVTVIAMLALRALAALGSKVTLSAQLELAATWPPVVGHVVAGKANPKSAAFAPLISMSVTFKGAPPLFVMVTI